MFPLVSLFLLFKGASTRLGVTTRPQMQFKPNIAVARTLLLLAGFIFEITQCYIPNSNRFHAMAPAVILLRSKRLRATQDNQACKVHDSQKSQVEAESSSSSSPLLTAGVLADIQYAPIPDGFSYSGASRYYQHALDVARHASLHFEREKVDTVLNLGDIVDGKCQSITDNGGTSLFSNSSSSHNDVGEQCVEHVKEALSHYKKGPILHTYGNHCLYNLDRQKLQEKLGIPFVKEPCGDLVGYYSQNNNIVSGTV
jgi:hypothetical protein